LNEEDLAAMEERALEEPDPEEDGFDDENESTIRAKWSMDGARTLPEAAAMLCEKAIDLLDMARDGWELTGPVSDDYGHIRRGR